MIYEWTVDEDLTLSDSEKPRYLLPEGCKDLYDVIRMQERDAASEKQKWLVSELLEKYASMAAASQKPFEDLSAELKKHASVPSKELPQSLTIPDPVTVGELAGLLLLKPYQLISLLIRYKIFASNDSKISFEIASKVCARLGVAVKKLGES